MAGGYCRSFGSTAGRLFTNKRNICELVKLLLDENCKDQDTLFLINYLAEDEKLEKILGNPQILKTPVVRGGKQSTIGYQPDVWKKWE